MRSAYTLGLASVAVARPRGRQHRRLPRAAKTHALPLVEMSLNTQYIRYTAQPYGRNHVRLLSDPGPCTVTSRTCSPRHVKQGRAPPTSQVRLHDLVPALWVRPAEPAHEPACHLWRHATSDSKQADIRAQFIAIMKYTT